MSILFDDASSQYLSNTNPITTSDTVSLSCWMQTNDTTVAQILMSIGDSGSTGQISVLLIAGGRARTVHTRSISAVNVTSAASVSANTWYHVCGVVASPVPTIYLNGTAATTAVLPLGSYSPNRCYIARRANNAGAAHHSGLIAEAAIYSVALTADDVLQLSSGFSPKLVRPESLLAYWPLLDQTTPSIDVRGGYDMTWNASPTVGSTHPAMFGG